jgi:hypothetical protein
VGRRRGQAAPAGRNLRALAGLATRVSIRAAPPRYDLRLSDTWPPGHQKRTPLLEHIGRDVSAHVGAPAVAHHLSVARIEAVPRIGPAFRIRHDRS